MRCCLVLLVACTARPPDVEAMLGGYCDLLPGATPLPARTGPDGLPVDAFLTSGVRHLGTVELDRVEAECIPADRANRRPGVVRIVVTAPEARRGPLRAELETRYGPPAGLVDRTGEGWFDSSAPAHTSAESAAWLPALADADAGGARVATLTLQVPAHLAGAYVRRDVDRD